MSTIAKAGMFITVDEHEYSDFVSYGTYLVLRDFEPLKMLEEYLDEYPDQEEDHSFHSGDYFGRLLDGGYLKLVETQGRLHLGAYSRADYVTFWADDEEEQQ